MTLTYFNPNFNVGDEEPSHGVHHKPSRDHIESLTQIVLKQYIFFIKVMKNLHVVFTMNPSTDGLKDRAATSPALFNRCVLNWFGDWSDNALYQVSQAFYLRQV